MPTILTIAGSDSSSGAGIAADLRMGERLGVCVATAITAVTAQNDQEVALVYPLPEETIRAQIEAVMSAMPVGAIKTGMLAGPGAFAAVQFVKRNYPDIPFIMDPVCRATSGSLLGVKDRSLVLDLCRYAELITPNIQEAEWLTNSSITSRSTMLQAAEALVAQDIKAILLKGGHLPEAGICADLLWYKNKAYWFEHKHVAGKNIRGTGCMLATAIACFTAQAKGMEEAVESGVKVVQEYFNLSPSNANSQRG